MSTQAYGARGCTSYATDVRPKFTDEDVEHMKDFGIDLSDYASVVDNADLILTRLKDKDNPMPPAPPGPWSPEWIECFEQWIANGKQP
jgi:hypothetical protein